MRHRKLVGTNVSLAPIETDDAVLLAGWLNDLEVAVPLGDEAHRVISIASVREAIANEGAASVHSFLIVTNEDDQPIGRCLLANINLVDRSAMLGIFIGDKRYWGRGYGTEAARLLLDYGFNLLNLHSVMLGVFGYNTRALNCYRKLGFTEIGRRRQARQIGGRYHDVIFMDMLASEFDGSLVSGYLDQSAAAPHS